LLRRDLPLALAGFALAPLSAAQTSARRGPLFWLVQRGRSRVYLLGFADAKADERAWFTANVRHAFYESSELWEETAPREDSQPLDEAKRRATAERLVQLGHQEPGHTLFDDLAPPLRERTLEYMGELGMKREAIEGFRPWRAYYAINAAYRAQHKESHEDAEYADEVLRRLAITQGRTMGYELPTQEASVELMASMPLPAQVEYLAWLLDYFDDKKNGVSQADFDWQVGRPDSAPLDGMRSKYPQLYRYMQVQRNIWWARKIDQLLAANNTYFVLVGQLHVLGADGIPEQLQRLGIVRASQLRENPTV